MDERPETDSIIPPIALPLNWRSPDEYATIISASSSPRLKATWFTPAGATVVSPAFHQIGPVANHVVQFAPKKIENFVAIRVAMFRVGMALLDRHPA